MIIAVTPVSLLNNQIKVHTLGENARNEYSTCTLIRKDHFQTLEEARMLQMSVQIQYICLYTTPDHN